MTNVSRSTPRRLPLLVPLALAALALGACGPAGHEAAPAAPAAEPARHVVATPSAKPEGSAAGAGAPVADGGAMGGSTPTTADAPGMAGMPGMTAIAADAPLPGASVYHLGGTWAAADGGTKALADLRGHPVVVVLFYGSCTSACPLLVHSAQLLEGSLSEGARAATRFLMVTIDPEHDTPERLAAYARDKGVDRPSWLFLTGSELQTRQLAAVLGVRYRAAGGGMFSHSNVLTLLDGDGVAATRVEGLGADTAPLASAIEAMVR